LDYFKIGEFEILLKKSKNLKFFVLLNLCFFFHIFFDFG